jgi:hypothetical protein
MRVIHLYGTTPGRTLCQQSTRHRSCELVWMPMRDGCRRCYVCDRLDTMRRQCAGGVQ